MRTSLPLKLRQAYLTALRLTVKSGHNPEIVERWREMENRDGKIKIEKRR